MNTDTQVMSDMHWQQDLLGSIEVGIVVADLDFTVKVWNQFMENHSDIRPSQICGKSLFEFFPEIDKTWLISKVEPVHTMKTPSFIIWEQRRYLFKFGTSRPITSESDYMYQNVTIFPLASPNGKIEKICILVYDVTDQALNKKRIEGLNTTLQDISRIDGLTQLFNRRYWQERYEHEFKLTTRSNKVPASVMMLDIDHFKKVNDTYGHQAGDAVIMSLAKLIRKMLRATDIAGRYGGEEFAIFLPGTPAAGAEYVGNRIRKAAEQLSVTHDKQAIKFTVSVGVAQFDDNYKTPMLWLEDADKALYEAKESGRNKVILFEPK